MSIEGQPTGETNLNVSEQLAVFSSALKEQGLFPHFDELADELLDSLEDEELKDGVIHVNLDDETATFNFLWSLLAEQNPDLDFSTTLDKDNGRYKLVSVGDFTPFSLTVVDIDYSPNYSYQEYTTMNEYEPAPYPARHLDPERASLELLSAAVANPSLLNIDGKNQPHLWMLGARIVDTDEFSNPQLPLLGRIEDRIFLNGFWQEAGGYNGASMPATDIKYSSA